MPPTSSQGLHQASLLELSTDEDAPSKWWATILYASEQFRVDSDILLVADKPPPEVTVERFTTMGPFDWDSILEVSAKNIALQCLDQAFVMTHDSVQHIRIEALAGQYDDKKSTKGVFRATALKDFKVGELMLTPYSLINPEGLLEMKSSAGAETQCDKSQYIMRTYLSVIPKESKKSKKPKKVSRKGGNGGTPPGSDEEATRDKKMKVSFYVKSPLDKLKTDQDCARISPLWMLSKTTKQAEVNMAMELVCFDFLPMTPISVKVPNPVKKALFSICLQCGVNNRKIKKGEALRFSMMEGDCCSSDESTDGD